MEKIPSCATNQLLFPPKHFIYIVVPWPLCTNHINLKNVEIFNNLFFKDQIIVKETDFSTAPHYYM
jgi:hypothetical protein